MAAEGIDPAKKSMVFKTPGKKRSKIYASGLMVVILVVAAASLSACQLLRTKGGPAKDSQVNWIGFSGNAGQSGSVAFGPKPPLKALWTGPSNMNGSAIYNNMVYGVQTVKATTPPAAYYLIALDAKTGARKWRAKVSEDGIDKITAANNKIFVLHRGLVFSGIHAYDAQSGKLLWKDHSDTGGMTVYGNKLFAIGAIGEGNSDLEPYAYARDLKTRVLKWRAKLDPPGYGEWGQTVVAGDGRIYIQDGSEEESYSLLALDADTGKAAWRAKGYSVDPYVDGRIIAAENLGDGSDRLVVLDAKTGRKLWQSAFRYTLVEATAGYGGRIFTSVKKVGSRRPMLYAFDVATGKQIWQADYHDNNLAVAGDRIYDVTGGRLLILDSATGKLKWRSPKQRSWRLFSPIMVSDDMIFSGNVALGSKRTD